MAKGSLEIAFERTIIENDPEVPDCGVMVINLWDGVYNYGHEIKGPLPKYCESLYFTYDEFKQLFHKMEELIASGSLD